MRRVLAEELDLHIADVAAELETLGYSQTEAIVEANKRFGDRTTIEQELNQLHPWLSSYTDVTIALLLVCSIFPLHFIKNLTPTSLTGLISEQLIVWWWLIAAITGTSLLLAWMYEVIELPNRYSIILGAALITEVVLSITAIMDINNFETAIDNVIVIILVGILLSVIWPQLTLPLKRLSLVVLASVVITAAFYEHQFFPMWHGNCQFILADEPLTTCQQIPWYSPNLWLVYIAGLGSLVVVASYLNTLWHSQARWHRKLITGLACLSLPLVALAQPQVNTQGAVDVIPWKREIYDSYREILGRDPEQKDLEFYQSTYAYRQMHRIRKVLYASPERATKINLLFQDALGRAATPEELDYYMDSYFSVTDIEQSIKDLSNH